MPLISRETMEELEAELTNEYIKLREVYSEYENNGRRTDLEELQQRAQKIDSLCDQLQSWHS